MLAEAVPELVTVVVPVVFSAAAIDGNGKPSAGPVAAREELASAALAEAATVAVAAVAVAIVVFAAGAMSAVFAVVGATVGFSSVDGCAATAVTFSSEAIGGGAASPWSPEVVARVLARVKIGRAEGERCKWQKKEEGASRRLFNGCSAKIRAA